MVRTGILVAVVVGSLPALAFVAVFVISVAQGIWFTDEPEYQECPANAACTSQP